LYVHLYTGVKGESVRRQVRGQGGRADRGILDDPPVSRGPKVGAALVSAATGLTAVMTRALFSSKAFWGGRDARRYVTHTGERPMGITWKLETPMPAAVFERFAALLAA